MPFSHAFCRAELPVGFSRFVVNPAVFVCLVPVAVHPRLLHVSMPSLVIAGDCCDDKMISKHSAEKMLAAGSEMLDTLDLVNSTR